MPEAQTTQILNALNHGETLTAMSALNRFGCLRLAARVNDLRNRGVNINSRTRKFRGKRFAEYYLG
jgi:hypothetical protein